MRGHHEDDGEDGEDQLDDDVESAEGEGKVRALSAYVPRIGGVCDGRRWKMAHGARFAFHVFLAVS